MVQNDMPEKEKRSAADFACTEKLWRLNKNNVSMRTDISRESKQMSGRLRRPEKVIELMLAHSEVEFV